MADKNIVLDGHAFADECMAGDLAAPADLGVFLNFDKGSDLRFVADFASVQVDELGEPDTLSQFHVRRN